MQIRFTRIFLMHLLIALSYLLLLGVAALITSPALTGLQLSVCVCLHLVGTLFYGLRKRLRRGLLMAHLAALFLVIGLLQLSNTLFWQCLHYWQQRLVH